MDLLKYLKRINYSGEITPSIEVLNRLQYSHLMTIPFENIDIQTKVNIELENSYNKIVNNKRGGFCYELNYSFYQLLKEIGFEVKMISARVFSNEDNVFGPEYDHMALIATIKTKQYLVDVGFGEFSLYPLVMELNIIQNDPRGDFRIEQYDDEYLIVKKMNQSNTFSAEYIFSTKERSIKEFYQMCKYHQTNSKSHFTQKLICSLATVDGRITISDRTFKKTKNGVVSEQSLKNEEEIRLILLNDFNINIAHNKGLNGDRLSSFGR